MFFRKIESFRRVTKLFRDFYYAEEWVVSGSSHIRTPTLSRRPTNPNTKRRNLLIVIRVSGLWNLRVDWYGVTMCRVSRWENVVQQSILVKLIIFCISRLSRNDHDNEETSRTIESIELMLKWWHMTGGWCLLSFLFLDSDISHIFQTEQERCLKIDLQMMKSLSLIKSFISSFAAFSFWFHFLILQSSILKTNLKSKYSSWI